MKGENLQKYRQIQDKSMTRVERYHQRIDSNLSGGDAETPSLFLTIDIKIVVASEEEMNMKGSPSECSSAASAREALFVRARAWVIGFAEKCMNPPPFHGIMVILIQGTRIRTGGVGYPARTRVSTR